jgi:cellulose synthase (UDP-forming)
MILHSRGYQSVYVPKILAAGLAPESFESYLKQRKRWTRGGIQVFLLDNPLWKRGLTFAQRIQYFSALFYFFHGRPRLIYLSAPISYLVFGVAPLITDLGSLALHFIPYYASALIAFQQVGGKARNPFWSDVYETAMCFSTTLTIFGTLLSPWRTRFHVTPKGVRREKGGINYRLILPHLTLAALLMIGAAMGCYELTRPDPDVAVISIFWAVYNLIILIAAISVAKERKQVRRAPRLSRMFNGSLRYEWTGPQSVEESLPCVTVDISETGASLRLMRPSPLPSKVALCLMGNSGKEVLLPGNLTRNDRLPTGEASIGMVFTNLTEENRRALIRLMFGHPRVWSETSSTFANVPKSVFYLLTAPLRTFIREKILQRFSPRIPRVLACQVLIAERFYPGMTHDVSAGGMSIVLSPKVLISPDELKPDQEIIIRLWLGNELVELPGRVAWKKCEKDMTIGVRLSKERPDLFPPAQDRIQEKSDVPSIEVS